MSRALRRCRFLGSRAALLVVLLGFVGSAAAQDCSNLLGNQFVMKGKISRNFYRIPYLDEGFAVSIGGNDYWGHGGSIDMIGGGSNPKIVAPADGVVCYIKEDLDDCGCHGAFGGCGNLIMVKHANGEYSGHLHIAQWSAFEFGIHEGDFVTAGTVIAREGDVGRTCGNTSSPRIGDCVFSLPPGTGNCGRHDHWNIVREVNVGEPDYYLELLQPMTCEIPGNLYTANSNYLPGDCSSSQSCVQTAQTISGVTLNGFGDTRVFQNADRITATTVQVTSQASAVMHAANRIRLLPGFTAGAGGAYFRAEIGPCNETAPAQ